MPLFDTMARQYADEIRVAAYRDRIAEPRGEFTDASHVATSSLTASLIEIARSLEDLTHGDTNERIPAEDKECIIRRTAQRLGVNPQMLQVALQAVVAGNVMQAKQCLNHLLDHAD
jgi:chromosome condensin MukBEF ATPase and DNA-binding subunit MukB